MPGCARWSAPRMGGQEVGRQGGASADAEDAAAQAPERLQLLLRGPFLGEEGPGVLHQQRAGLGEGDPARRPHQQLRPALQLQQPHRLGDRRLAHPGDPRRPGEPPVGGHRQEQPQGVQVEGHTRRLSRNLG